MTIKDGFRPISPTFFAKPGGVGARLLDSIGNELDEIHSRLKQSILARFPGVGTNTALPYLGRDDKLEIGLVESEDDFAARLPGALDEHATKGNARTLLRQLRSFFAGTAVPSIRVVSDRGLWHEIDCVTGTITKTAPSGNWQWDAYSYGVADAGTQRWWRAWVVIDMSSGPWGPPVAYGDPITYGDGSMYGLSGATREELAKLARLLGTWKPKNVHVVHPIVTFDASLFNPADAPGYPMPDGTFGEPTNRPTDAAYLKEVIQ